MLSLWKETTMYLIKMLLRQPMSGDNPLRHRMAHPELGVLVLQAGMYDMYTRDSVVQFVKYHKNVQYYHCLSIRHYTWHEFRGV